VYRFATILFVTVACPALAAAQRNCDPRAGLVDGSCVVVRPVPWWKCEDNTYDKQRGNPEQQRRLENFGLGIFSPELPGYGPQDFKFTRSALIKRFGQPLTTSSKERQPYDPSDPTEILTSWEYRGFRIVTVASKPSPDVLWLEEGEIFDAKVSLQYGVRIGQSIDRWTRQFGQPDCRQGIPPHSQRHVEYAGQYYFACGKDKDMPCVATYQIELYPDGAGRVQRIRWSHPML
jgi:hypothetical protein